MKSEELDRLFQQRDPRIVSVEITPGSRARPDGAAPPHRVTALLDDGHHVELFAFHSHDRSFTPEEFVGLTVTEARRLKLTAAPRPSAGTPQRLPRAK